MTIGLEAMRVYVPRSYLDAAELARVNGVDPQKYTIGIGVRRIAIPGPYEDAVTMAYEAASALLSAQDIDSREIGMLIVGSETGVDAAKPIAAYVHGLLNLHPQCRTFDAKHACYSATAALKLAKDWCMGAGQNQKALVLCFPIYLSRG